MEYMAVHSSEDIPRPSSSQPYTRRPAKGTVPSLPAASRRQQPREPGPPSNGQASKKRKPAAAGIDDFGVPKRRANVKASSSAAVSITRTTSVDNSSARNRVQQRLKGASQPEPTTPKRTPTRYWESDSSPDPIDSLHDGPYSDFSSPPPIRVQHRDNRNAPKPRPNVLSPKRSNSLSFREVVKPGAVKKSEGSPQTKGDHKKPDKPSAQTESIRCPQSPAKPDPEATPKPRTFTRRTWSRGVLNEPPPLPPPRPPKCQPLDISLAPDGEDFLTCMAIQREMALPDEPTPLRADNGMAGDFFASIFKSQQDDQASQQQRVKVDEVLSRDNSDPEFSTVLDMTDQEKADELYCQDFCASENPCPYCHEPLPIRPSADLLQLKDKLDDTTGVEPGARLSWRQTITFCAMHRAETHIIPLGRRAGYPGKIDFKGLDGRLESGFIRVRLRRVAAKPQLSKFFRRAKRQVETLGPTAWKAVANQSTDAELSITTPGYFGDLGRTIIISHFQHLVKWGHLPSLAGRGIEPLSASDFIVNVMVPEAAVLLIMEDNGWKSDLCKGVEWDMARAQAMSIHTQSAQYGRARFREDGAEGRQVLQSLENGLEKKRLRLEATRRREQKEIDALIKEEKEKSTREALASAVYVHGGSSDAPDPSEYEISDGFWPEASRVAREYDDRDLSDTDCSSTATPVKTKGGRSLTLSKIGKDSNERGMIRSDSSVDDRWDDEFTVAAVTVADSVAMRA